MVSFRVKVWVTYIVFSSNGIFRSISRVRLLSHSKALRMVSFRVKVWVTYIVFLSNGIFHSKSRGRLDPRAIPFLNNLNN